MKSLYRGVGKLWSSGGGDKRRGAARQTRKMDPTIRRALQSSVQEETTAVEQDFDEIQAQLEQAIQQWEIASEKERFVGVRYRKYRQALDAQARELHEERGRIIQTQQEQQEADPDATQQPEPADAEEGNVEDLVVAQENLDRRMEKWEEDEDALQKIAATHKQILVTCEEMRRNIDRLEKKKKEMISLKEECDHFLTVAGEAQERENSGQGESSDRAEGLQQSQDDVDVETTDSLQESTTGEEEPTRIGNEEQMNEDVKDDGHGDGDDETKDEETGEKPGSDASENIEMK